MTEILSIDALLPHLRNARVHSKKQLKSIAASIRRFGFVNPVIVASDNTIIAGHGRVEAAKLAGLNEVPVVRLATSDPTEIRAYMLADNQLATKASWDFDLLVEELQFLQATEFDLDDVGFDPPEVDLIFQRDAERKSDSGPEDHLPFAVDGPAICRHGDVWQLGHHRLVVGDSIKPETYVALMGDEKASMVLTDPPFNVVIAGNVSGLGKKKHKDFAFASGEMSSDEFTQFLTTFLRASLDHVNAAALTYVFMDWRHATELLNASKALLLEQVNLCIWNKTNAGMGSFYRSQHELCFIFKHGSEPHRNNVQLGKHGRSRTNVWTYAGVNTFSKDRDKELASHPTVKPAQMIADAIRDATKRGELVLDPFGGSGTIIIACEMTGRKARMIEYDPAYADGAINRFQAYTGKKAILTETGENFELVEERRNEAADKSDQSQN